MVGLSDDEKKNFEDYITILDRIPACDYDGQTDILPRHNQRCNAYTRRAVDTSS